MRKKSFAALIGLLFLVALQPADAQGLFSNPTPSIGANAPSYYYLGGKEGLTIAVNLWGFVRNPGRYEVPSSTDLVQLISLGGGPLEHAELDGVRIVRQILQPDSTYKTEVIPVDLNHYQNTGAKTPLLLPGDTIIVPGSTFNTIEQILSVFRDVALIFSGVATLMIALKQY
jgi:SLBB domain